MMSDTMALTDDRLNDKLPTNEGEREDAGAEETKVKGDPITKTESSCRATDDVAANDQRERAKENKAELALEDIENSGTEHASGMDKEGSDAALMPPIEGDAIGETHAPSSAGVNESLEESNEEKFEDANNTPDEDKTSDGLPVSSPEKDDADEEENAMNEENVSAAASDEDKDKKKNDIADQENRQLIEENQEEVEKLHKKLTEDVPLPNTDKMTTRDDQKESECVKETLGVNQRATDAPSLPTTKVDEEQHASVDKNNSSLVSTKENKTSDVPTLPCPENVLANNSATAPLEATEGENDQTAVPVPSPCMEGDAVNEGRNPEGEMQEERNDPASSSTACDGDESKANEENDSTGEIKRDSGEPKKTIEPPPFNDDAKSNVSSECLAEHFEEENSFDDHSNQNDEEDNDEADDHLESDDEENVELIKFPENVDESNEEMILPHDDDDRLEMTDSQEGGDSVSEVNCSINDPMPNDEAVKVNGCTERPENVATAANVDDNSHCLTEESQMIACESDVASERSHTDDFDPLNASAQGNDNQKPLSEESHETGQGPERQNERHAAAANANDGDGDDDDDDDIQIIETRNSPIYLLDSESEDETENVFRSISSEVTITPVPPQQGRFVAKKSTAKPHITTEIKRKTKNMNYLDQRTSAVKRFHQPENLIATIDLLDSSDDNGDADQERQTPQADKRTPNKRKLLPAMKASTKKASTSGQRGLMAAPSGKSSRKALAVVRPRPSDLAQYTFTATPQSNFLHAVNLQPANATRNPPAFAAQISNRNVIIPNAFYGNPPEVLDPMTASRSDPHMLAAYKQWLDNFLLQFFSPLQVASDLCFVILQRVLPPGLMQRIRHMRMELNKSAKKNNYPALDLQLMIDLRNVFLTKHRDLTDKGFQICELAFSETFGKAVPLTTDARSGRVTSRTRLQEELLLESKIRAAQPSTISLAGEKSKSEVTAAVPAATTAVAGLSRKRRHDDAEYTPDQGGVLPAGPSKTGGERRRSLRTKRKRRYDESFSYNEDIVQEDDEEDEQEEDPKSHSGRKIDPARQRETMEYIEAKRLEAKQQRERQAKSFESAFIETFARCLRKSTTKSVGPVASSSFKPQLQLQLLQQPQLQIQLQPPPQPQKQIECIQLEDDDDDMDPDHQDTDEPKQHRIYKPISALTKASRPCPSTSSQADPETTIECIDLDDDDDDEGIPANTNSATHSKSKDNEWCVICKRQITRIVHHYVNNHRGSEVYNSRLPPGVLKRLKRKEYEMSRVSYYKNGQPLHEAACVFCLKQARFMLPYWFQHFSMHTGEYAYKCTGCHLRKPTRSLLTAHVNQPCPKRGKVHQVYTFNPKTTQIIGFNCSLCNYLQLHRFNVVAHLRRQHNVVKITAKHIQSVVLLNTPQIAETSLRSAGNDENNVPLEMFNSLNTEPDEDYDPSDDLSFMICGMLDVQLKTE